MQLFALFVSDTAHTIKLEELVCVASSLMTVRPALYKMAVYLPVERFVSTQSTVLAAVFTRTPFLNKTMPAYPIYVLILPKIVGYFEIGQIQTVRQKLSAVGAKNILHIGLSVWIVEIAGIFPEIRD